MSQSGNLQFCSGNDACVLTTIYSALHTNNISLVGGTGDGEKVSANGRVYRDAVAYALVKNLNGKVKTYKENIYHQNILHVSENQISTQTFKNPFGKIMKLHRKSRKETKSLYPVLYVIERFKEYRNMLVQSEVDSCRN